MSCPFEINAKIKSLNQDLGLEEPEEKEYNNESKKDVIFIPYIAKEKKPNYNFTIYKIKRKK
jgi:hypothetical protein